MCYKMQRKLVHPLLARALLGPKSESISYGARSVLPFGPGLVPGEGTEGAWLGTRSLHAVVWTASPCEAWARHLLLAPLQSLRPPKSLSASADHFAGKGCCQCCWLPCRNSPRNPTCGACSALATPSPVDRSTMALCALSRGRSCLVHALKTGC